MRLVAKTLSSAVSALVKSIIKLAESVALKLLILCWTSRDPAIMERDQEELEEISVEHALRDAMDVVLRHLKAKDLCRVAQVCRYVTSFVYALLIESSLGVW